MNHVGSDRNHAALYLQMSYKKSSKPLSQITVHLTYAHSPMGFATRISESRLMQHLNSFCFECMNTTPRSVAKKLIFLT